MNLDQWGISIILTHLVMWAIGFPLAYKYMMWAAQKELESYGLVKKKV